MSFGIERYGDVRRLRMSSVGSRAFNLDVSAYVVRGVLIDSGFHRARADLLAALASIDVRGVIVTHWHEDHAGNVSLLAARGVPIHLRADTRDTLRRHPDIRLYRRVTWGRPPALTVDLADFDLQGLECVSTPGHSSDHQVVWDPETGTLFSGDLWLGVRARTMHSTEDPYAIVDSLRRVAALQPARMFDAHRGLIEPAGRAIERKIDWLSETLAEVERRIAEGLDDRAIVRRVLGGETLAATLSQGDYTTGNFVRAVRRRVSR